jgi:hypothetical protein
MPLLTYDAKDYNLDKFIHDCIKAFQDSGYYLTSVGPLTQSPGAMFALTHIDSVDDAQLHMLKSIFYKYGAKSVTMELNTMNNNIYFRAHVKNAVKPTVFLNIYKYIPPLPVIFIGVLWLYEIVKHPTILS